MANFWYFGTFPESTAMLVDAVSLDPGLKLLHDSGHFESDVPRWFLSVDDELTGLLDKMPCFVIAGSFTRFPLGFTPSRGGGPGYGLAYHRGGPVLAGRLGRILDMDGVPSLTVGEIWYQPHYLNPMTDQYEPASEDVKAAYRAIVRRMKRHLLKRRLEVSFWITPEAWRLWREGRVRFPPWSWVKDGRAELPYPFPPSDDVD